MEQEYTSLEYTYMSGVRHGFSALLRGRRSPKYYSDDSKQYRDIFDLGVKRSASLFEKAKNENKNLSQVHHGFTDYSTGQGSRRNKSESYVFGRDAAKEVLEEFRNSEMRRKSHVGRE